MQGDNFRAVSPETAAWALQQHFAASRLSLEAPEPSIPEQVHRVPSRVAEVIRAVLVEHRITAQDFLRGPATKRTYQARQAAYRALREMRWGGSSPSYSQIARWCNRHPSSVHHYFEHVAPFEQTGAAA
jgi:hypothetical protein